jgi:16S rRNA processing protein RimM
MKKEDCFFLGYISRKHGYKGQFNIKLESTPKHKELGHLFIDTNGSLVPFFIDSFRMKKENIALVKLEDVDTEVDAQALIGKESTQNQLHELIGFEVIDAMHGNIGKVTDILDNSAQELFQIYNGTRAILIPITEEFIKKIEKKTIYLETPEGLIDL